MAYVPDFIDSESVLGVIEAGCDELDRRLASLQAEITTTAIEQRSRCDPRPVEVPGRRAHPDLKRAWTAVTVGTYLDVNATSERDVITFGGPLTLTEVIAPFPSSRLRCGFSRFVLFRGYQIP